MTDEDRQALATQIETKLRPLVDVDRYDGGYGCCGCSTYDWIIDDAIAIVVGNYTPKTQKERTG